MTMFMIGYDMIRYDIWDTRYSIQYDMTYDIWYVVLCELRGVENDTGYDTWYEHEIWGYWWYSICDIYVMIRDVISMWFEKCHMIYDMSCGTVTCTMPRNIIWHMMYNAWYFYK